MAVTPSTMLPLGTQAPHFALPDTEGKIRTLEEFKTAPALLVAFICNHCPFVKHIRHGLVDLGRNYQKRGAQVVAINANDTSAYPEDSPAKMAEERTALGYTFPYLYDESQEVAKAYGAACTPDFFLFDAQRRLVYRGQMDDSRPGNDVPVTGSDLLHALDCLLSGQPILSAQKPSTGCNIKWRKGNEPGYFSRLG